MTERLTAYLGGRRVGWLTREAGPATLTFEDAWRATAARMELSLSMPKSRREHGGAAPLNYLWNLLPDNDAVLERWGARFSVSPRNPIALLAEVGLDTAGAVQLSVVDEPTLTRPATFDRIDDAEVARHIRELRTDPEGWLLPGHARGYFSLAGAQSKFALARVEEGWAVPTGRAASTHIFKPGIAGLPHSALNEHLTLTAASHLGLPAASSRILSFDGEAAIVVERFDRRTAPDGPVERLHQEDLAQATGTHPARKYQNEGGPGIRHISRVIRDTRARDAEASVQRFFEATLFAWATLGTDAHAKNYALLHDPRLGARLAPLYDVATALPYPDLNDRRARLSMSYGGHYRMTEIEARYIAAEASAIGLEPEWALDRAREIVGGVTDAYAHAARDAELAGDAAEFAARIIDASRAHSDRLLAQLAHAEVPRPRASIPRPQARNKDVDGEGNPGAFASPG